MSDVIRDDILFSADCDNIGNDDVAPGMPGYLIKALRSELYRRVLQRGRPFADPEAVGEHPVSVVDVERGARGTISSVTVRNEDQSFGALDPALMRHLHCGVHPRLVLDKPLRATTAAGEVRFRLYRGFYLCPELFGENWVYVLQLGRTAQYCPCTSLTDEFLCRRCGVLHWSAPDDTELRDLELHGRPSGPELPREEWHFEHLSRGLGSSKRRRTYLRPSRWRVAKPASIVDGDS